MAPTSRPWTSGAGDGTTAYTAAQWASVWRKTYGDGVLRGIGGELAVSGGASPLTVQAGAAFVDGIFFEDPASTSLAVATPAATTGGHVVLRADWTARTARLVAVLSSSGVTTPPNVTQNSGTLYEIRLATFTMTNAGVITLTDVRPFARFSTRIADAQFDTPKVSRAGDTMSGELINQQTSTAQFSKAAIRWWHSAVAASQQRMQAFVESVASGSGGAARWALRHIRDAGETSFRDVINYDMANEALDLSATALRFNGAPLPFLSHRQGGDAANWDTPGTNNYSLSAPLRGQLGFVSMTVGTGSNSATTTVTFPFAFGAAPLIFLTTESLGSGVASAEASLVLGAEAQQVRIEATRPTGTTGDWLVKVRWLAIGPA